MCKLSRKIPKKSKWLIYIGVTRIKYSIHLIKWQHKKQIYFLKDLHSLQKISGRSLKLNIKLLIKQSISGIIRINLNVITRVLLHLHFVNVEASSYMQILVASADTQLLTFPTATRNVLQNSWALSTTINCWEFASTWICSHLNPMGPHQPSPCTSMAAARVRVHCHYLVYILSFG